MVFFKITGGELKPELEMSSSATILELKEWIHERLNVEIARQALFFDKIELEDDRTIESYEFEAVEILGLVVTPVPEDPIYEILVKSTTAEARIRVRETQKVVELRGKIERLWGIPTQYISLSRHGIVMDDHHPLSAYYVNQGCTVVVKVIVNAR